MTSKIKNRALTPAELDGFAAELDAAMFAWTRLTIRTREIERTLSGINLLFPET